MNTRAILDRLLANARKTRAARITPGSEQDRAWQSIVPNPEHRALAQPLPEAPPAPADTKQP